MRIPERPANEQQRLHSLYELELLDTDTAAMFDGAVELAAQVSGCPIALVSLLDSDRQWFAAARNLDASETGRDVSFCGHAILDDQVMVVPDARIDARFHDNPLVTADPNIVFYAGAPLAMPDGTKLGTVCVIDREPRYLSDRQVRSLTQLSRFVVDQLELRRSMLRLEREAEHRIREHRKHVGRVITLSRDLSTALHGVDALARKTLVASEDAAKTAEIAALLECTKELEALAKTIGSGQTLDSENTSLQVSRVDPADLLRSVISSYSAELKARQIDVDLRLPSSSECLLSDRERLRFLIFHLIGFLLSRPVQGVRLTLKVRPDPNSGIEVSGYLASDHPYRATTREHEDLELLNDLAETLGARLTTLLDDGQLQVRIRLPLQI